MRLHCNDINSSVYSSTGQFDLWIKSELEYTPLMSLINIHYMLLSISSINYRGTKTNLDMFSLLDPETTLNRALVDNSNTGTLKMIYCNHNFKGISLSSFKYLSKCIIAGNPYYLGFNCIYNSVLISGVYIQKGRIFEAYLRILNEDDIPNEWLVIYINNSLPAKLRALFLNPDLVGIKRVELNESEFKELINYNKPKPNLNNNGNIFKFNSTIDINLMQEAIANKIKQVIKSKYARNN